MRMLKVRTGAALLFLALVVASCGGGESAPTASSPTTAPAGASEAAVSPAPTGAAGTPGTAGTAASDAQQLKVLDFRHFINNDSLYYVGQVQNTGVTDVTQIVINLKLVGSDGKVYTSSDALKALNVLPAGGTMPFKILFKKPPPSPGDEIFSMSSVSTTADTAKDYRAFQVTVEAVDSQDDPGNPGAFVIRGQVANQGSKDVARVKMTFVGYDSTGKVIAAWNGPGPDGLKAGSSGAFGFAVLDSQGTPTNYAMIVTGS